MPLASFNEKISERMIDELYSAQLKFWNHRLQQLAYKNAQCHNHPHEEDFNEDLSILGGIVHKGRTWTWISLDWLDEWRETEYSYPLFIGDDKLVADVVETTEELMAIKKEKYETQRFMSGLSLFQVTKKILESILGENLFYIIRPFSKDLPPEVEDAEEVALMTYVKKHKTTLEHMNQRVLVNLITVDSIT